MKVLIITDRENGQHLSSEVVMRHNHADDTITTKNLNGVTTGDIDTWLGNLTDDYYGKIHVLVNANVTAGTGVLSKLQMAVLLTKADQALITALTADASGTCQSNSTSTVIKLAATETGANDFFNDMFVITAGTTEVTRLITDWVLSTKLITVADTTTAITTSETYKIFSAATLEDVIAVYAETYEAPEVFGLLYPNMTNKPLIIAEMGAMPGSPCLTATANSVATSGGVSTLTDTSNFTADAYDDEENQWYVAIRSATTGAGQVLPIVSNTVSVLTLGGQWDPVPTGTIVYEVVDRKHIALAHYFLEFAFRHLIADPSEQKKLDEVMEMLSKGVDLTQVQTAVFQNLEKLAAFKEKGQIIMRSIGQGITS